MAGAGHRLDQDAEEGPHESGVVLHRDVVAALFGHVGDQCERQGMSPRELHHPVVRLARHTAPIEQCPTLLITEVVQADGVEQSAPPGIGAPGHGGRLSAREDGDGVGAQRRQQVLPEPAVQGDQQLGRIHQQDQPPHVRHRAQEPHVGVVPLGVRDPAWPALREAGRAADAGGPCQCCHERRRQGRHVVPVDPDDPTSRLVGQPAQPTQQGGLPHATRAMDEDDRAVLPAPEQRLQQG